MLLSMAAVVPSGDLLRTCMAALRHAVRSITCCVVLMALATGPVHGQDRVVGDSISALGGTPVLSIADASVVEGNHVGGMTLQFTASLSKSSSKAVSFSVSTQDGSAVAGSDYKAISPQRVSIAPGETTTVIAVDSYADTEAEDDETFRVIATDLAGAAAGDLEAIGSIINDDPKSGIITTIAGGGNGDGGPAIDAYLATYSEDVAYDLAGNLYIAENGKNRIRKVTPAGIISTVAGTGERGDAGDGGPATAALLNRPFSIATDASGNLYIADTYNGKIRKVDTSGIITTVAGNGSLETSGDGGSALQAGLSWPNGLAVGPGGDIYLVDANTRIRKIAGNGVISTVVGNGSYGYSGDGGPAVAAGVNPYRIAVDAMGSIYITDHTNHRIRKVGPDGIIRTIAGDGVIGFSGDGGDASAARIYAPYGIGVDSLGNVSFADYLNRRIRRIDANGKISTIAGTDVLCTPPSDQATCAYVFDPYGVAVAPDRSIAYLAYGGVYRIGLDGTLSKLAGGGGGEERGGYAGDGGPAIKAILNQDAGVAIDGHGNVYIADTGNHRIRRIGTDGIISTYAGTGVAGFAGDGQAAAEAKFNTPGAISLDMDGNLYVLDQGNRRIRRISASGMVSTVAGNGLGGSAADGALAVGSSVSPSDIAVDAEGRLHFSEASYGRVRRVAADGLLATVAGNGSYGYSGDGGPATSASFRAALGIDFDQAGNLYIADSGNYRIRRVSATGVITTFAGSGVAGYSGDGGIPTQARLSQVIDVHVDPAGDVLFVDYPNIRRVSKTGTISTTAGNGTAGMSGDGGLSTNAKIVPSAIATDGRGNIYLADSAYNRVRKVTFPRAGGASVPGAPTITQATAGDRSATIMISPPADDGGSSITGYTLASTPAGAVDGNAGSTLLQRLVTGLDNGVSYTFQVMATNALGSGQASAPSAAVVPLPVLTLSDAAVAEGHAGMRALGFTLSLSAPAVTGGASFDLRTEDVRSAGAAARAGSDYLPANSRVVIPEGQASSSFTVKIIADTRAERDESFLLKLGNAAGVIIGTATARGTILNDDSDSLAAAAGLHPVLANAGRRPTDRKPVPARGNGMMLPGRPDMQPNTGTVPITVRPPGTLPATSELAIATFDLDGYLDAWPGSSASAVTAADGDYLLRLAKVANLVCAHAGSPDVLAIGGINERGLADLADAINSGAAEVLFPGSCRESVEYVAHPLSSVSTGVQLGLLVNQARGRHGLPFVELVSVAVRPVVSGMRGPNPQSTGDTTLIHARVRVAQVQGGSEMLDLLFSGGGHGDPARMAPQTHARITAVRSGVTHASHRMLVSQSADDQVVIDPGMRAKVEYLRVNADFSDASRLDSTMLQQVSTKDLMILYLDMSAY